MGRYLGILTIRNTHAVTVVPNSKLSNPSSRNLMNNLSKVGTYIPNP